MEVDQSKRMVFADLVVVDIDGSPVGTADPAKFIYRKMPESPTTEVSMLHSLRDDLYIVMGTANPESKVATFQVHVNPLVSWIWIGVLVLICGVVISMWPEVTFEETRAWSYMRAAGAGISSIMFAILLALTPARAFGQSSSSLHAGTVEIHDPVERALFGKLRCMCGGCPRLALTECICSTADATRAEIRAKLRGGSSTDDIMSEYVHDYGAASINLPPNRGAFRAIYAVPLAASLAGLALIFVVVRRWKRHGDLAVPIPAPAMGPSERDEYDAKLDEELKKLDA